MLIEAGRGGPAPGNDGSGVAAEACNAFLPASGRAGALELCGMRDGLVGLCEAVDRAIGLPRGVVKAIGWELAERAKGRTP